MAGNKFGGFSGGGNMQQMMKQAQKMQQDLQKAQQELAESEITATSGGGMVEVTVKGSKELVAIKINPEVVDPKDVEMLEDMIIAAINEAYVKVDTLSSELLGPMAGMLGGL